MPEQITFTTAAFGGFEKKQVLDYIFKVHEELDQAQINHKKKLEEISIAFKDLENRAIAAEKNNIKYEQDLQQIKERMKTDAQENMRLEDELKEYKENLSQYERILSQRKSQQQQSSTNLDAESQNLVRQKQEIQVEYQRMEESSAKIGRVMLDAHNKAELVVASSQKEANRIMAQAQDSVEKQRIQMNKSIQEYQEQVNRESQEKLKKADEQAKETHKRAEDFAKETTRQAKETHKRAEDFAKETTRQAEEYAKQLRQDIQSLANRATGQLKELNDQLLGLGGSTQDLRVELDSFTQKNLSHLNIKDEFTDSPNFQSFDTSHTDTEKSFDYPGFLDFKIPDFDLSPPSFSEDKNASSTSNDSVDYDAFIFQENETTRESSRPVIIDPVAEELGETYDPGSSSRSEDSTSGDADPFFSEEFLSEPETATPEPETATPEPETATPEPETATPEPETATPEPEVVSSISDELNTTKSLPLATSEIPKLEFHPDSIKKDNQSDLKEFTFPSLEPPE